ncbi:MAG: hypothetical protein J6R18_05780 [Kiritimatiellae bacterium]|nr:hypothetical protein [Kiritimatiellia bacterium]
MKKITKAEDGTFSITGIRPNELEVLMYMVKTAECEKCENLYRCKDSSPCAAWLRDTREAVHQHWIEVAETEAERNFLRERFYGKAKQ